MVSSPVFLFVKWEELGKVSEFAFEKADVLSNNLTFFPPLKCLVIVYFVKKEKVVIKFLFCSIGKAIDSDKDDRSWYLSLHQCVKWLFLLIIGVYWFAASDIVQAK